MNTWQMSWKNFALLVHSRKLLFLYNINRFGVIPKKHYHNWRLIFDLSHPMGFSINDGIPKDLCSLQYITVDTAIRHIVTLGQGTLLAKLDAKSAFQLMPVHPTNCHLVTMCWNDQIYVDTCLPFGLRLPQSFQYSSRSLMMDFGATGNHTSHPLLITWMIS